MNGQLWLPSPPFYLHFLSSRPFHPSGIIGQVIHHLPFLNILCLLFNQNYQVCVIPISIVMHVNVIKVTNCLFLVSTLTTTSPLKVIFFDVWTSLIHFIDDFKYYVIFVDHFTKYVWFHPPKIKSHVFDVFVHFKSLVENHFQPKIVTLYFDNRGNIKHFPIFQPPMVCLISPILHTHQNIMDILSIIIAT